MNTDLNEFKQVILKDIKLQEQGTLRNKQYLVISAVQTILLIVVIIYMFSNQGKAVDGLKSNLKSSVARTDSISKHLLEIKAALFKRDSLHFANDKGYKKN
jgi:uncharacterized membrane protein YvbJ